LTVTVVCSTSIRRRLDRLDLGQVADPVLLDRGAKPKTGSRMWSSVRQIKKHTTVSMSSASSSPKTG